MGREFEEQREVAKIIESVRESNAEAGLKVKEILLKLMAREKAPLPVIRVLDSSRQRFERVEQEALPLLDIDSESDMGALNAQAFVHRHGSDHYHDMLVLTEEGIYRIPIRRPFTPSLMGDVLFWDHKKEIAPAQYLQHARIAFLKYAEITPPTTIPSADFV